MKRYTLGLLISFVLITGCEANSIVETKNNMKTEPNTESNIENRTTTTSKEVEITINTPTLNTEGEERDDYIMGTITNSKIKEEITNASSKYNEQEINFMKKIMGRWTYKYDEDLILDLNDYVELIGVSEAQLMTRGEFSVSEINIDGQFIIIHIFSESIDYESEENLEIQEDYSKLYLVNNGKELLYVSDYLGEKNESEWIK